MKVEGSGGGQKAPTSTTEVAGHSAGVVG